MVPQASPQVKGNLPADAKEIVGRRRELSEARRLLPDTRLLTLTGPGGVGKTRLGLRVAAEVRSAFPDGVWLVELAPLQDVTLLARTVAVGLGLCDQSARPSAETLADYLRDKRLLLVLDNCEHLLDACAHLASLLLSTAGQVRILATSREPLGMAGETLLAVPPLSVPEPGCPATVNEASTYDSVRLFVERAQLAVPDFTLSAENSATVVRLCQRLEGIPLAIQLAAVWIPALSPEQILERLDDRYRLLTRGFRTALPRHQTLRAAMDWSFDLCSRQEQALWARLSVFAGGFDLEAVERICAGDPFTADDVFDLVTALIDKSIVARDDHDARTRYRLLETVRQYGHERLVESGTEAELRRRHRDCFQQLVEEADAAWFTPHQTEWLNRVRLELANIRVALDFCLTVPGQARAALRMCADLYEYWVFYGAHSEARHWLDQALQLEDQPSTDRFDALAVNATIALLQGEAPTTLPLLEERRDHAHLIEDSHADALTMSISGLAAFLQGDLAAAVPLLKGALDGYGEHHDSPAHRSDRNDAFLTSVYLSFAATFLEDPRARAFAESCRKTAEASGAEWALSWGAWVVGLERWRAGDVRQAANLFQDALSRQYALDDRWGPAWVLEALAWVTAADCRAVRRAAFLLGVAENLRRLIGVSLSGFRPFAVAHDRCAAGLRESLGDKGYEAAFQRGLNIDVQDAIADAVGKRLLPEDTARAISRASSVLTSRERQVAELVAEGMSNKDIASRLVISQRTAEAHVEHILTKLGFTSRAQIAAWTRTEGGSGR
ncbi:LuxR C-terminal-related transcriptional regulator [Nonomuraea sp. NPDC005650]|uniref:ATP-binding protein n=1 Tax=Nonomuraea sp. NPDC005650 TaxID=3157045 RepID=UPI0033A490FB